MQFLLNSSIGVVVFSNIYNNGIGGCVFALDVADLEEKGDCLRNLCVLSKDVGDCFWVREVVVEVCIEMCAQVLSPSMLRGFSQEKCQRFRFCLVQQVREYVESGMG